MKRSHFPYAAVLIALLASLAVTLTCAAQIMPALYQRVAGYNGFLHRETITINHLKVSGDQTNYVLTINDTDPNLRTMANGGYVQNASGYDIVYTPNANCTSPYSFDAPEKYVPTTGQHITEVLLGPLSGTVDTALYRCFDKPSISTFQGGATGAAWPNFYAGVWHLNETSGTQFDSTSNGRHSTAILLAGQGTGTGKINGADVATNSTDRVTLNPASFAPSTWSIEAWVNAAAWSGSYNGILRMDASGTGAALALYITSGGIPNAYYNGNLAIGTTAVGTGALHHVAVTSTGPNGTITAYIDGASVGTVAEPNSNFGTATSMSICGDQFSQPLHGVCDEVRLTNSTLSSGRIQTDYNNQSSPSTFYTVGALQ